MSSDPLYIAYYTPAYKAEADELIVTLRLFDLPHEVLAVPDLGSWQRNTQAKAAVIRDAQNRHIGRPLVYVDADARIRQRPALFETLDCDFAAHWRGRRELLSGTLYFAPTIAALSLVDAWVRRCQERPDQWDQRCLQSVVESMTGLREQRLPWEYCRIFDGPEPGEPVIEHMQASRRLKR